MRVYVEHQLCPSAETKCQECCGSGRLDYDGIIDFCWLCEGLGRRFFNDFDDYLFDGPMGKTIIASFGVAPGS